MITPRRRFPRRDFLSRAAALLPGAFAHPFLRLAATQKMPLLVEPSLTANPQVDPIRFELAPPSCGLDFVLRNGAQGRKYQVETLLGGLGVIDYDIDGWPDLFCVNG